MIINVRFVRINETRVMLAFCPSVVVDDLAVRVRTPAPLSWSLSRLIAPTCRRAVESRSVYR
jgi:hypothetical protein